MSYKKELLGEGFVIIEGGVRYTTGYCAANSGAEYDGYLLLNNQSKYRFKKIEGKLTFFGYDGPEPVEAADVPETIVSKIYDGYSFKE